jgi:hypothetical protein
LSSNRDTCSRQFSLLCLHNCTKTGIIPASTNFRRRSSKNSAASFLKKKQSNSQIYKSFFLFFTFGCSFGTCCLAYVANSFISFSGFRISYVFVKLTNIVVIEYKTCASSHWHKLKRAFIAGRLSTSSSLTSASNVK